MKSEQVKDFHYRVVQNVYMIEIIFHVGQIGKVDGGNI